MEDATVRTRWIFSFLVKQMPPVSCPYPLFLPKAGICISVWGFLYAARASLLSIQQALGAALINDQLELVYKYPSSPPHGWANSALCVSSLTAQWVKNPPVTQETRETWVRFLGREDPLEKEMATYSSILVWKIPWTQELEGLQSKELQRVRHDWATKHAAQSAPQ